MNAGGRARTNKHSTSSHPARPARITRLWRKILASLRVRRGFHAQATEAGEQPPYYRETSTARLAHALSRRGPGFKQYRVTFPDGSKMLLHHTNSRVYADIAPSTLRAACEPAIHRLKPGQRALIIPGGTGDIANAASTRVGPSGAVVSLDHDDESIRYAARRYRRNNIAFEVGRADSLAGEVDGAFDAVITIISLQDQPDTDADAPADQDPELAELWRVVAPGGWMFVAARPKTTQSGTTITAIDTPANSPAESAHDAAIAALRARTASLAKWTDLDSTPDPETFQHEHPTRRSATPQDSPATTPALFLDKPFDP